MGPLLGDFKFAPLTPESELETLGGGDTRVGSLCVCCRIGPAQQHAAAGIIAAGNGVVSVRDPRGPQDLPADQSVRRYKLQPCLPASARGEELFAAVGERSSGSQRVGLACWEVLQNEAINLLPTPTEAHAAQRSQASANPSAFDSVEVASAAEAHAALLQAQTRSCNWGSDAASSLTALPNRAHTFVRITLYDAQQQRVSTLHIVDLVGSQSLSQSQGVVGSSLEAPDTLSQRQRERRVVNQQLLGLTRIISELAQKPALTGSTSRLLSARESKLTQILAPLLAGNSRTFMLATLSPDPANYLDTINTLRVATRAQAIKTACMTTRGVPPETVKMLPIWRVLSVEALNSSQGGPQLLPGHRELEELRTQNVTILTMMEREKRTSESLRARAKEMEAEHLEACAQYEVRIQEDRMAALNLRSKCRKLESETLFASVFEKYEQEITQLQTEVGRLKEENSDLAKQAAAAEPKPLPGKLGRASEAADVSKALADPTSAEGRLVALRRKLKKTEGERDALRNEVLDLKKRDRLSELYHKKAEDGIKRVNELQRKLHAREAELEQRTLACTELAERSDAMQAQLQRVQKENADFANERAELQESLHSLRNQVRLLRSQRKREVVLANLPPVRHVEQRSRTASAAVDLCRRLQREVNCSPKAEGLVERLVREVQAQIEDRLVLQQRENILMDLLTGPPNSGGC
ncbi:hypothetical protein WJX72_004732 [[Myrmecia] bisecta]|uniref:Kinesin motor domain-containing protein n=1 Tax=[Myrmecia] bisecta TaxID=41462 RepID=A0AAW1PYB8_9CHLO